jgi:zinc protease
MKMKSYYKSLPIYFLLIVLLFPYPSFAANRLAELEKTPLPEIHIPNIKRLTLKNGMRLLLLQDDELPVVRGYMYIRTGSIYDPPEKVGLAALTGEMLREGGTQKHSPDKFDEALAAMGADLESEIGREFGTVFFKGLKEDLPQLLGLTFEMLREPRFDPQRFQLNKIQMLESLRRQNDDPSQIAMREFPKLIYGRDNIWSRTPTTRSVQALTREDVEKFYHDFYFPNRIILAISGDFQEGEVLDAINKLSDGWPEAKGKLPKLEPLQKKWEPGTYLIEKSADQATVILGHYGDKRFNPDKYALLLLNEILGGDVLSSRLGKRIRSTLGLAYSIYSQFGLQTDYGIFYITAQTKAPNTSRVFSEVLEILNELRQKGSVDAKELDFYKQSLLNSLYSQYEPKDNFAKDEARFEYLGYPPNYLQLFRSKIQEVSLADLSRVAQKYLQPDKMKALVVGDSKKIGELTGVKILELEN